MCKLRYEQDLSDAQDRLNLVKVESVEQLRFSKLSINRIREETLTQKADIIQKYQTEIQLNRKQSQDMALLCSLQEEVQYVKEQLYVKQTNIDGQQDVMIAMKRELYSKNNEIKQCRQGIQDREGELLNLRSTLKKAHAQILEKNQQITELQNKLSLSRNAQKTPDTRLNMQAHYVTIGIVRMISSTLVEVDSQYPHSE